MIPAQPFFRWVGGKRRLVGRILPLLPVAFRAYHEPFLGGGALFLRLESAGWLRAGARLADANPDLVNAFICVRDEPGHLIDRLALLAKAHSRERYYAVRDLDRAASFASLPAIDRAARFIYLANASFNGGWRVDDAGRVVSAPSSKALGAIDACAIQTASRLLQAATVECLDFRQSLDDERVGPNDLVFLDPPHLARGAREDPARYTAPRFSVSDQRTLDDLVLRLADRGVWVVLSVAWSDDLERRYPGFSVVRVDRPGVTAEALVASAPALVARCVRAGT
jgi:DNA adenine methylase